MAIAILASIAGLLISFHADIPAGPAVVLTCGALWGIGLIFGRFNAVLARRRPY